MKYHYYPGCSLEGTAVEYNQSTRAVMETLDVELSEIKDWTCCGASAAEATSALLAMALPARNLALAEQYAEHRDILVPCSACYLNLKTVEEKTRKDPQLMSRINSILAADQLSLRGHLRVRHLLDVLATDLGPAAIVPRVQRPLAGLRIAPYYGCQCLRPYAAFDDPEMPCSMEPLIRSTGAEVFAWRMGGRCCGASHMSTQREVGIALVANILKAAQGADAIVTVCPMCQMNLEAFQNAVSRSQKADLHISVLYLPQLIGLALGLSDHELGLRYNFSVAADFRRRYVKDALAHVS
jgi:heterodisulfide reductase subunit B